MNISIQIFSCLIHLDMNKVGLFHHTAILMTFITTHRSAPDEAITDSGVTNTVPSDNTITDKTSNL